MIITIDGPTASGKSTLANAIANELKIYYINSGYMYRGLAYVLVNYFNYTQDKLNNPDIQDLTNILDNSKFIYLYNLNDDQMPHIIYDGEDISSKLKTSQIDNYSSIISSSPLVRQMLIAYQRTQGDKYDLVIDGRDCGSIVFPDANFKFFLTASIEARAERWQKVMEQKDKYFSMEESIKIISERDRRDRERKISPLIVPDGGIIIDSTNFSQDEVLQKVLDLVTFA